jgi:glycosyltransferase involved in cell wall biosynthesis
LRHGDYTNPVKFFQYLASGTPIAATDLPFLEEFINKNLALAVCKPDSVDEFAECLSEALSKYPRKPEGYPENINLSRQFTWEKRMERILALVGMAHGQIK